MKRPRLLFLCQTLPYPPDGGVQIRSYNVLRLLAREYDVTALVFYRQATRPTVEQVRAGLEGVAAHARASVFPILQEHNRARLLWDHLRSTLTRRVYTYYAYESADFTSRLRDVLDRGAFDLVHVDSLDLSRYIPLLGELPVACTHHNIESDLLRRRADTEAGPMVRRYLRFQSRLMEAEERRWCGRLALNVMVSAEDARRLQELVPQARVVTVPNGVDTKAFRPSGAGGESGIVFVGGFGWYPNRDGMTYFAEKILPLIRERRPDVEVTWVGRAADQVRDAYER
ncbi:MAG: glycosyltransferase, partial [Gemmatimonadota bacterium]